jgi:hypothetical protein
VPHPRLGVERTKGAAGYAVIRGRQTDDVLDAPQELRLRGLGLLFVEHAGVTKLAAAVVASELVAVRTWG